MDSNDPDLEAFESNLSAIIWARQLGKTAELVSNLCPNPSDPQSIRVSSKDNSLLDSLCGTSSHCQSDSDDSQDDLEKSAEYKFKGHLYFAAGSWSTGRLMKIQSGSCGGAVFTKCSCSCPPHGNVSQFGVWTAWTRQGTVETADSRLCTGEIKWIGPASLEWEKLHGGISLHKIYILDTQEKTDLKNTKRFLLCHGKNSEALI